MELDGAKAATGAGAARFQLTENKTWKERRGKIFKCNSKYWNKSHKFRAFEKLPWLRQERLLNFIKRC